MTISKLYYESHIAIEPIEHEELLAVVKRIAEGYGFRVADLYMVKPRPNTPERSNRDTFLTGHGKILNELMERMRQLIDTLQVMSITVYRYKIEDTILDSRTEDVLGMLDTAG